MGEMAIHKTTKHFIPHPDDPHISIVGVLEQLAPEQLTEDRKISIVRYDIELWRLLPVSISDYPP
jgi:hypothetical protein